MFDEVVLNLGHQRQFAIITRNNGPDHPYIQSVRLNGAPYTKTYIDHETIMRGGALEFVMGATPNKHWGANPQDWPSSMNN